MRDDLVLSIVVGLVAGAALLIPFAAMSRQSRRAAAVFAFGCGFLVSLWTLRNPAALHVFVGQIAVRALGVVILVIAVIAALWKRF
jgi:hypothetical protein